MERALGVVSDCYVHQVVKRESGHTSEDSEFDPIGFLAPFLVRAKIFLQHVCQIGIECDDVPPAEFPREWSKCQEELDGIAKFCIPRFCLYRHILQYRYIVTYQIPKTRIAPKKPLSLPRMNCCFECKIHCYSDWGTRLHHWFHLLLDRQQYWFSVALWSV